LKNLLLIPEPDDLFFQLREADVLIDALEHGLLTRAQKFEKMSLSYQLAGQARNETIHEITRRNTKWAELSCFFV
jgi:elongation factor P hydroxylase